MPTETAPNTETQAGQSPAEPTSFGALLAQAFPDGSIPQSNDETPPSPPEPKKDVDAPITESGKPIEAALMETNLVLEAIKKKVDEKPEDTSAADATTEPKKEEAPKLSDDEMEAAAKRMTPQAGSAFKQVRSELKTERTQRQALEARAAELEAKLAEREAAVDPQKLTELQERVARYEAELSVVNVEATDEFRMQIAQPLEQATNTITSLAKKYEVSEADLRAALSSDPAQRTDRLAELSQNFNRLDLNRFDRALIDMERLEGERQSILSKAGEHKQTAAQRQQQAMREAQENFRKSWKTALDKSYEELADEMPLFKPTGDADWDTKLEEMKTQARSVDLQTLPHDQLAGLVYKAGAFPMVLDVVGKVYQQNQELAAKVKKLMGATPGAGAGSATRESAKPEISPEGSFRDLIKTLPEGSLL